MTPTEGCKDLTEEAAELMSLSRDNRRKSRGKHVKNINFVYCLFLLREQTAMLVYVTSLVMDCGDKTSTRKLTNQHTKSTTHAHSLMIDRYNNQLNLFFSEQREGGFSFSFLTPKSQTNSNCNNS